MREICTFLQYTYGKGLFSGKDDILKKSAARDYRPLPYFKESAKASEMNNWSEVFFSDIIIKSDEIMLKDRFDNAMTIGGIQQIYAF